MTDFFLLHTIDGRSRIHSHRPRTTHMLARARLFRDSAFTRAPCDATARTAWKVCANLTAHDAGTASAKARRVFDGRESGIQAFSAGHWTGAAGACNGL